MGFALTCLVLLLFVIIIYDVEEKKLSLIGACSSLMMAMLISIWQNSIPQNLHRCNLFHVYALLMFVAFLALYVGGKKLTTKHILWKVWLFTFCILSVLRNLHSYMPAGFVLSTESFLGKIFSFHDYGKFVILAIVMFLVNSTVKKTSSEEPAEAPKTATEKTSDDAPKKADAKDEH